MIGHYGNFHPGPWSPGGPAMQAQYAGPFGASPADTVALQTSAAAQVGLAMAGQDVSAGFRPLDVFGQAPANDLGALYRRAYWLALTYRILYGGGVDRRPIYNEAKKAMSDANWLSLQPVTRQGADRAVSIMAQTAAEMEAAIPLVMMQRPRADRIASYLQIVRAQANPAAVAARQQATASGGGATIPGPAGKVVQAAGEAIPKGANAAKDAVQTVVQGAEKAADKAGRTAKTVSTAAIVVAGMAGLALIYYLRKRR